ncbi:hypothetical protein Y695_03338 [Hydrogenophaga sp. T4]|nr:hypothetical protein Y695_03338 [Hydrogenophaga sp. T4]
MRVPTRSAGTRSGVNWMRLNCPCTTLASVFTVSVLASPGTPSTSRWPCASMATMTRSRKRSWPTTTRFTSYRICSMSWAVSGALLSLMKHSCSEWGETDGAGGAFNRHGKADTDKGAVVGGVEDAGDDADHLAVHGDQRPAGIARVRRRVELDQVVDLLFAFR